jgi:tRNA threonylcarbamoyladenosine biosynthesis protein TsaE
VSWRRRCATAAATQAAGEALAPLLVAGDVVLLTGPLGAGKTTFTQGVARGLGVVERVTSPTFTIVRQHRCGPHAAVRTLQHADIYRVEHLSEVVDLALGELAEENAVCVIEWGEIATSVFGEDVLTVEIAVEPDDARHITVGGARAATRTDELAHWGS